MTTRIGLLALPLLLLPSAALAQATLIGTIGADSRTTPVSAAAPLPVTGTVTTTAQTGAGAVTATTARTVTATNSPDVTALGGITSILSTLTTAFAVPGGALPPLAILTGMSDGTLLRALRARDLDTGAGTDYWQGVGLMLAGAGGGTPASAGAGAVDAGTIRVVEASISSGTSDHVDVDASEVAVLAAKAGRRFARVQVYSDVDGGVCCALGATTNACADGIMLDASPAAGKAGGSAEWEGYGGAITCRAAGAWTTTVATEEW
jgi:hypothetical protein